ncbi:MAG: hypothetical protein WDW38_008536 [Sanguina aurantia]
MRPVLHVHTRHAAPSLSSMSTTSMLPALHCPVLHHRPCRNSISVSASHTALSQHQVRRQRTLLCTTQLHGPLLGRLSHPARTRLPTLRASATASVAARAEPLTPLPPTVLEVDTALTQVEGMSAAAEQLLTLTQPEAEAKLHAMKAAGTDSTAFELSMMLHRTAALFPQDATRWAWQKAQLVRYIFYCSSQVSQQKPVKGKKAAAEPPGTLSICGKDAGERPPCCPRWPAIGTHHGTRTAADALAPADKQP